MQIIELSQTEYIAVPLSRTICVLVNGYSNLHRFLTHTFRYVHAHSVMQLYYIDYPNIVSLRVSLPVTVLVCKSQTRPPFKLFTYFIHCSAQACIAWCRPWFSDSSAIARQMPKSRTINYDFDPQRNIEKVYFELTMYSVTIFCNHTLCYWLEFKVDVLQN